MVAVVVEFGPFVCLDGVLDGERMQPELPGEGGQVVCRRRVQIDPDDGARVGPEPGAGLVDAEALGRQPTIDVKAGLQ